MTDPADPALLVAVPLVASVLPVAVEVVLSRPRWAWRVAVAAVAGYTGLVVVLSESALAGEPVRTVLGGFSVAYGIPLVVDGLSAPFLLLTAAVALGVLAAVRVDGPRSGPFLSLVLSLVAGVTGVAVTADVFNLYVFLEISGLASYALVAVADDGAAAVAALKYLLVGTVGASLYLLGVAYVYVAAGTLSVAALPGAFAGGLDGTLPVAAFALMTTGLAVKMALFPIHGWKPDAYAAAPGSVAALLSALVSTVAAYAVLRLLLSAFTVDLLRVAPLVRPALVTAGVVSIGAGSVLAVRTADVRRLLAYSSVAQFGIVTVGIALATPTGVVGVVVHLVGHAVTKAGFYLAAAALAAGYGVRTVDDYAGLAARTPVLAGAVGVLALGLVGIPPTVGFAGKLYVLLGALEGGAPIAAAAILASTLTSLVYFAPLLQRVFAEPVPDAVPRVGVTADGDRRSKPERATVGVVAGAAVLTLALGLGAAAFADLVAPTVEGVLG